MTEDELDLVETDDLIMALQRRNRATLIVIVKDDEKDDAFSVERCNYSGGHIYALGLAAFASNYLLRMSQ